MASNLLFGRESVTDQEGKMFRVVDLTDEQRNLLETTVRLHPKAYVRERAAAILKVADGWFAAHVARSGLLRTRDPDTLYGWLDRFETDGLAGLSIKPGRGRKPVFSPSVSDERGRARRPAPCSAP